MADNTTESINVLVMDDEPLVLASLSLLLESLGHSVEQTTNGEEALAAARTQTFDMAILDLMVQQGLGGEDIVHDFRRISPTTKIVLSSGYAGDRILENPTEFGFDDKLLKPFSMTDLASLIARSKADS